MSYGYSPRYIELIVREGLTRQAVALISHAFSGIAARHPLDTKTVTASLMHIDQTARMLPTLLALMVHLLLCKVCFSFCTQATIPCLTLQWTLSSIRSRCSAEARDGEGTSQQPQHSLSQHNGPTLAPNQSTAHQALLASGLPD